ncbi:MAG: hypothetical protein KY429_11960 [Actinobacteria bacterium]|nr:hypothetical protein [Actinomycetota bacterium]
METSEESQDRIRIVIDSERPGRFIGQPHMLDKLRNFVIAETSVKDVGVHVNQVEKATNPSAD